MKLSIHGLPHWLSQAGHRPDAILVADAELARQWALRPRAFEQEGDERKVLVPRVAVAKEDNAAATQGAERCGGTHIGAVARVMQPPSWRGAPRTTMARTLPAQTSHGKLSRGYAPLDTLKALRRSQLVAAAWSRTAEPAGLSAVRADKAVGLTSVSGGARRMLVLPAPARHRAPSERDALCTY